MLNYLHITDLPQVAGLMYPKEFVAVGELPVSYKWAEELYEHLENSNGFKKVNRLSYW